MRSHLFILLCLSLCCFVTCKNTPKQIAIEKETTTLEKEPEILQNTLKTKPEVKIESTLKNEAVNIPEKKEQIVVIEKEISNNTAEVPTKQQIIEENPNVDSRLKFKLEEVSTDELNSKIRGLFETIEEKIISEDFNGWYNSLSSNYCAFIENPDELLRMSKKSAYLKRKKIVLRTAKDYFDYIVIPSREGIALKYVNFQQINEKNIKVNCMLDGNANFVYDFVYENDSWKLDKK